MDILILIVLFIVLVAGTAMLVSQGFKKGAGTLTTTVLGANDMLLTEEKKKAAEVIVDQNAGKRFEEQSSKGKKDPVDNKYYPKT